mgnify:CR=1 FL=1
MITHRGIWAIAHMLSRSVSKHSYIPGAYHCKHLLIPCPTNGVVGHILAIVSNKHTPASLDQGANWFGAPATNVRRVSEANRIFNRTNPPIVAKIKDYENYTHAKFAQFSNNWQRFFFRHTFAIQVVNHWPTPIANSLRSGTCHAERSRARVHDIWATIHMSSQQLAATDCFHCVTKVSYS